MPTTAPGLTLFTPYFAARTAERQAELDLCLDRNLACQAISRVVLLVDDGHQPPVSSPKLIVLAMDARPTYADWIRLSAEHAGGDISVLANSDIYLDDSADVLAHCLEQERSFVALSRYEKEGDELKPHPNPAWSQDLWALRMAGSLAPSLVKALDIPLGVPRCDNKIAYLFAVHGWQVHNPMAVVRSVHVHETQQRHYDKKADLTVVGAVAYVHPSPDAATPSDLDIDVWALNTPAIRSVKLNRSLDNWAAQRSAEDAGAPAVAPRRAVDEQPARPAGVAGLSATPKASIAAKAPGKIPTLDKVVRPTPAPDPGWQRFVTQGQPVFEAFGRFGLYRLGSEVLALDWLRPDAARRVPRRSLAAGDGPGGWDVAGLLPLFVDPVVDIAPITVSDRPAGAGDLQFWQYPAATEKQALHNHLERGAAPFVDPARREVHTYLGLPWATYIDKKRFPDEVSQLLVPRLRGLRRLVASWGHELRVHTVCQQIHWRRMVSQFASLQVSDLHLSHLETLLDPAAEGWPLRLHSWPLIAPNVEDPTRRDGLRVGKPVADKRYLASFIGAHMPHYRSDIRVKLFEAAKASGRDDVLMDLGNEWHFNKVVYKEQVQHKALTADEQGKHDSATRRYNEVLSDSVFSLCPEGAGPNTLRVWESLAVGAIPVILADGWVPPPPELDQPDLHGCCVFHPMDQVGSLFATLAAIGPARREQMQARAIDAYARLRRRTTF